jgi:hypothetical protein
LIEHHHFLICEYLYTHFCFTQYIVFGCDAARDIGETPVAPYLFDSEPFFSKTIARVFSLPALLERAVRDPHGWAGSDCTIQRLWPMDADGCFVTG